MELDNKQLLRECAEILDKKRQFAEAAMLFEKCEQVGVLEELLPF